MSFADEILQALIERDTREKAYEGMIEHHRKLSAQMLVMRDRNRSLLKASKGVSAAAGSSSEDNPVRAAYVASLEAQIAKLRDELADVYKTQSQNTQRLLTLTESLREAEDRSRSDSEHIRELRSDMERLQRKAEEARTLRKEKEKNIEHLNDELATLQLEYTQLEQRNENLQKDNRELLQRWLERVQGEASQLNDANAIIEQADRLRSSTNGRGSSTSPRLGTSPTPNASSPRLGGTSPKRDGHDLREKLVGSSLAPVCSFAHGRLTARSSLGEGALSSSLAASAGSRPTLVGSDRL